MRIIRFVDEGGKVCLGLDGQDGTAEVLRGGLFEGLEPTGQTRKVARLLAPLEPKDILCIGLNYRKHAEESNLPIPESPVLFMKPTSCAIGSGEPILIPSVCAEDEVDYECELVAVIGKTACNVAKEEALGYVFGYTCGNDVSARKWQLGTKGGQWVRGKSFRTFCPLGPAILTADEIPDPSVLKIRTVLNGKIMQDSVVGDLIFGVPELISLLSQDTILFPGTVILTGTPSGVGFARKPPVYLQDGDEVAIEIDKIGRLVNPVAKA